MKEIKVTTQQEFDRLPKSFSEFTYIYLYGKFEIYINRVNGQVTARENSQVTARGNSQVTAWGNSQVTARENSQVTALENSQVTALENSQVTAWGNSQVTARGNSQVTAWGNSQVTAWGNIQVTARGNSQVTAWGNSQVTAWENSQVTALENSQVTAWGNSQVTARGNSQVTAWGNSQVTARENSQVTALENSQVTARGNVSIHSYSTNNILLYGFCVCWLLNKSAKAVKKSVSSKIFQFKLNTVSLWLYNNGIIKENNKVILFKRVSQDFKTQENTSNETFWELGKEIEYSNYNPSEQECNSRKFHACSYPYFCDEFRDKKNDRYIAILISTKDLYAWPEPTYPHKIAFRKGLVLYECDKNGKQITK